MQISFAKCIEATGSSKERSRAKTRMKFMEAALFFCGDKKLLKIIGFWCEFDLKFSIVVLE